jgi:uncharacterized protein YacL
MINYDASIIQKFADNLYKKANQIIIIYSVFGFSIGVLISVGIGRFIESMPILYVIVSVFMALFGFAAGRERSFSLKLQAQNALCLKQIEENTRGKK